jgi:Tfp pilus assembly PilM family ATPase
MPRPDVNLAGELRRLLNRGGFKGRNLVLGLDPPDLVAEAISLPLGDKPLSDSQVLSALSFELGRHMNCDPEEAEIRAWRLPEGSPMAPTVMGVAARRELVIAWYQAVATAGYRCKRVDSGAAALARCCSAFGNPPSDSIWGVLDIGMSASRLMIAASGIPVLQREIPTSGMILSCRVAERLKLSCESAERLKKDHGIAGGYVISENKEKTQEEADAPDGNCAFPIGEESTASSHPGNASEVPRLIFSAVRRSLSALSVEVEKSMVYAMHLYGDLPVSTLYLVGGGAALKGLTGFLSQEIGIDVATIDLSPGGGETRFALSGDPGAAWARACGLALMGVPS